MSVGTGVAAAQERLYGVCDFYDAESLLTDAERRVLAGSAPSWTSRPGRCSPSTGSEASSRTSWPGR